MTDAETHHPPYPNDYLRPEQRRIAESFDDLRRLLGKGVRPVGAGPRIRVLNVTVTRNGQLDLGERLPERAAEVILYDRTGRIVSVITDVAGKQVVPGHPLAVRLTVHDATGRTIARGDKPRGATREDSSAADEATAKKGT